MFDSEYNKSKGRVRLQLIQVPKDKSKHNLNS